MTDIVIVYPHPLFNPIELTRVHKMVLRCVQIYVLKTLKRLEVI